MSYDVSVRILGVAPLIQHRYVFKDEARQHATRKSGSTDHSEEWQNFLYRDEGGLIYEPSLHLEGSLVKAAGQFQIAGRGKRTYRDLFKSAVFVSPDRISLGKKEPDRINKTRMTVNRSSVERYRPEFTEGWELRFTIHVLDSQVQKDVLRQILDHAGAFCGIGDSRPRYGRFKVVEFV